MFHLRIFSVPGVKSPEHNYPVVLLLVVWLLVVTSCTIAPPESGSPKQVPTTLENTLPESTLVEIRQLLRDAEAALSDDRLTTPVDDNAWYRYLRVLVLDSGNQTAQQGISDIVEKYLAWAIQDIEAGYLRKARNYLSKVRAIDPTHPNLPAVEKRLSQRKSTSQQIIKLSRFDLDNHTISLANQLFQLGTQIQQQNARVIIVARNDAEGRWIYQQLNKAEDGPRIRAQIQLDTTPRLKIFKPLLPSN